MANFSLPCGHLIQNILTLHNNPPRWISSAFVSIFFLSATQKRAQIQKILMSNKLYNPIGCVLSELYKK